MSTLKGFDEFKLLMKVNQIRKNAFLTEHAKLMPLTKSTQSEKENCNTKFQYEI